MKSNQPASPQSYLITQAKKYSLGFNLMIFIDWCRNSLTKSHILVSISAIESSRLHQLIVSKSSLSASRRLDNRQPIRRETPLVHDAAPRIHLQRHSFKRLKETRVHIYVGARRRAWGGDEPGITALVMTVTRPFLLHRHLLVFVNVFRRRFGWRGGRKLKIIALKRVVPVARRNGSRDGHLRPILSAGLK